MAPSQSNGVVLQQPQDSQLQSNRDSEMGWIVQKFGGTSVGKFAEKIAEDVVTYVLPRC